MESDPNIPKKNKFVSKLKTKKGVTVTIIFVITLIITIVGLVYLARFIDYKTNTALEIDGTRVTKNDYGKLVQQSKRSFATDEEAKEVIVQSTKAEEIAKQTNIDINDELLNERSILLFDRKLSELNDWERSKLYLGTLKDMAYFISQGGYEAYVFNLPFSINYGMYGDNPLKSPAEIEQARAAAQKRAEEVRSQVATNLGSAPALVTTLTTVEPYKSGYGFATNQSQRFYVTESGESFISGEANENAINIAQDKVDTIKGLKVGEVSAVKLESANLSTNAIKSTHPYYGKTIPIAYQVFYLKQKVTANKSVYDQVKKKLSEIKVSENE